MSMAPKIINMDGTPDPEADRLSFFFTSLGVRP